MGHLAGWQLDAGAFDGIYKIVSTLYMPHVVEQKMEGLPLIWEGKES